ncbi:hypothetical protein BDZ89DRAFT_1057420 [Hymenopellis radicata]|nr:hypothetical protein BDZ89DRAFT_1057420 [Hymenopellis radicata]
MRLPKDVQRSQPWFEDGNIILVTHDTPTAYRLHRGVLARHSEIFQDMFALPQPDNVDGCQVVTMHDIPVDLSNLVKALYDGALFDSRNIDDFFYLASILRLSTKYFIAHLRHQAILHLTRTWSYTLDGHDEMVATAIKADVINHLTYPYVHPLHVLNLARETHVDIIVPSVMYFLSLYRLEDLIRGDHAKLQVDHPSRPSSEISLPDIKLYSVMFQRRIEYTMDFVRRVCGERKSTFGCSKGETCSRSFASLASRLGRSWMMRTALLHYVGQVSKDVWERENEFCIACRRAFQEDCETFREEIWAGLPALLNLPSWEELAVSDLSRTSS